MMATVATRTAVYVMLSLVALQPIRSADAQTSRLQHVSAVQAATMLKNRPDIIVLDIRTAREYQRGHIRGAKLINYYASSFRGKIKALRKDATYLVHCAAGYRSSWSLSILKAAGLRKVIHMKDGLNAWKRARLPLVK